MNYFKCVYMNNNLIKIEREIEKQTSFWGKKWREWKRRRRRHQWCEGCWSESRIPFQTWISTLDHWNQRRGCAWLTWQTPGSSWRVWWLNSISENGSSSRRGRWVHSMKMKKKRSRGREERVWEWSRATECPSK